jgi:hypothetical protein
MRHLTVVFLLAILLASCGGSGSPDPTPAVPAATAEILSEGCLKDSAVQGLDFQAGAQSGVTDEDGCFQYASGAIVSFSLGNISFGAAPAQSVLTPVELTLDGQRGPLDATRFTNVSQTLLSLNSNPSPDQGISISPTLSATAKAHGWTLDADSPEFESQLDTILQAASLAEGRTYQPTPIDATLVHLEQTWLCTYVGIYAGSADFAAGDGTSNYQFGLLVGAADGMADANYSGQGRGPTPLGRSPLVFPTAGISISDGAQTGAFSGMTITFPDRDTVNGEWFSIASPNPGAVTAKRAAGSVRDRVRFAAEVEINGSQYFFMLMVDRSNNVSGVITDAVGNHPAVFGIGIPRAPGQLSWNTDDGSFAVIASVDVDNARLVGTLLRADGAHAALGTKESPIIGCKM